VSASHSFLRLSILVLCSWAALTSQVRAGETAPAELVVLNFTTPPAFSFLSWEDKPQMARGTLRLLVPDGRGGCGYVIQRDLTAFADRTPVLTVTVGEGNRSKSLRVAFQDADGTEHNYLFALAGVAAGATAALIADDGASLREPHSTGEAGKQDGFDLAQVANVVLVGEWSDAPVDVTVHQLTLIESTSEILAARAKLRQRRAEEAAQQKKAAEAMAQRTRELLAGAPHPADGPDVRHAALVAADILALSIQEKEFIPVAQIPYVAQDADIVKRVGKQEDSVLVLEDGKVQESLLEVVVQRKEGTQEVTLGRLAVNAHRIKPEDKITGQDLTTETIAEPAAYRVVGVNDPGWNEPLAPLQVWWKRKPNAPQSTAFEVQVFLKLPKPLVEGHRYRIEFPGINVRQTSLEYLHEPRKTRSAAVHVSAIGLRPDDPLKRAFLSTWLGTGGACRYREALHFYLLDDATGQEVFDGMTRVLKNADDQEAFKGGRNYSKTDVLGMDFSAFRTPGRYRVYVEGIGCSYPFDIAEDVWTRAFRVSMQGLLHHRSGIELGPPFTDYRRPRNMHPADGAKIFASEGSEIEGNGQNGLFRMLAQRHTERLVPDAWGGHMDAGDWDRNSAHPAAMWLLVDLYEMFPERIGTIQLALPPAETANAIPDILDEVLWNLDLYRRLQTPEGGVGGGIESTAHPRPGEASWQESLLISAYAPDPKASFIYAATAAKLARALATSDNNLSAVYATSARKAWDWAATNSALFLDKIGGNRRAEVSDEFRNRRNLAAFELWRLTGEATFHDEFKATFVLSGGRGDVNTQIKAITSYARLPDGQGDAVLREQARQWVIQAADSALKFADNNAFGITLWIPTLPPIGFIGYLSTPETAVGAVLPHAWLLTRDAKYLAGAVLACQFSAGANPDNRALTTGLGPDPVRFPLHIDSWVTGQRAPAGITVYGISDPVENFGFDSWAHTWFLQKMVPGSRTWPAHESYWDIYLVPSSNEFTIHQTIIPTAFYWGFLAARP
jgi:endoglucanase